MHSSDLGKIESSTEKSLKQPADLANLPIQQIFDTISNLELEVQSLKDGWNSTLSELKQKKLEVRELQEQLEFIKETNKLLSSELLDMHRKFEVRDLDEDNPESMKSQVKALQDDKLKLLERLKKSTSDINSLSLKNIKLQEDINELRRSKKSLELELTGLKDASNLNNNILKDRFDAEIKEKNEKIKKLEKEINELQQDIQKTKRNFQQEIRDTQEENAKTHRASEKELAQFRRDKIRDEHIFRAELDSTKQMYTQMTKKNEMLVKKLREIKKKHASSNHVFLHPDHTHSSRNNSAMSPRTAKSVQVKLNQVYKEFLGHISRDHDGKSSFYQIQNSQVASIEKQINDLIYLVSDKIQDSSPLKEKLVEKAEADRSKNMFSWLTPRVLKDKASKRSMSQRKGENLR